MDAYRIANMRLINQQLAQTNFNTPKEIVSWMGAMQAQDYNMAKWAVGTRLPGFKNKDIENAVNEGEIVRTHVLRPTWHFVTLEDIHWMLQLTAPRIKSALNAYDRKFGIKKDLFVKTNSVIYDALSKGTHLTRQEIGTKIQEAGIILEDEYRLNHIMFHAELDGIACSGVVRDKKQTYSLLEEKVARDSHFDKDEALGKLAYRYFKSHGPATIHDFVWWSGLSTTEARRGLEIVKSDFILEKVDSQVYVFPDLPYNIDSAKDTVHLLSAFDEFIVSYRDRKEILESEHYRKVITTNGIFRPIIVENGKVIGLWKRVVNKNKVSITTDYFNKPKKSTLELVSQKIRDFELYNEL